MIDFNRIKHALHRFPESRRRFTRRFFYRKINVRLRKKQSITYALKDLDMRRISTSQTIKLNSSNGYFEVLEHHFVARYSLIERNLLLNSETGGIYRENGRKQKEYITESSEWPEEEKLIFDETRPRRVLELKGKFSRGITQTGYYHIVTEELPQILFLSKFNPTFLQSWRGYEIAEEIYKILGVKSFKTNRFIRPEELYLTTRGKDVGYLHPENLNLLKEFKNLVFENSRKKGPEKIYVSRRNSRRSHPAEKEIQNVYLNKGFHNFDSRGMSIVEQINFFSNCREIAGLHGAGLTNAIWANECKLVEFMPQDRINRCFEWQSFLCNHEYQVNIL